MHVIGLTGGIASGKTLVSDTFAELGAPVVDADLLAREVVAPGSQGLQALVELFGEKIITSSEKLDTASDNENDDASSDPSGNGNKNGSLDRAALREIIFQDPDARKQVDALLHPMIRTLSDERIKLLTHGQHPYLIYAVPLLVETGQADRFDRIVVVDVPVSIQIQRLMARDDSNEDEARRIIESQASQAQRLAVANDVVDNSGTVEHTVEQVKALHKKFSV